MASSVEWTLPGPWQTSDRTAGSRPAESAQPHMFHAARMAPADRADEDLSALDEPALVEACLAARPGAFDVLVERHRRAVYLLCYRFVSNHEDASDLCQDVFLRAYRGLRRFRGHSSLATWLYRIGVNVCLNRVSVKTLPSEPIADRQFADTRHEPASEKLMKDERGARVRAAIARLPKKQRAALIMRAYHDMSHQEIADVLGTSVGAVKANFFHALGNLKKLLGGEAL